MGRESGRNVLALNCSTFRQRRFTFSLLVDCPVRKALIFSCTGELLPKPRFPVAFSLPNPSPAQ